MTRIIALDHGSRRIGVAVGDTETGMAFSRPALLRRNMATDLAAIADLVAVDSVQLIVIGLPLNMDGTEGEQAVAARAFGEQVALGGIGVRYEDERLSSWEAGEHLSEAGRRPRRRGGELDSAAARVILQQYLDARRRTAAPEETE
ncbi:MAG: Holliday junction resolvase RuvX [Chloroflexota bacterium]|nr:Holliday junction resolvase RuvX [Chloroflexota bacterium]